MHLQQILVLYASATATISPQPNVTISSGIIYGSSTNLPNAAATVNKFLGIPYAAAQRFSRPSDPSPWPSPLNTTNFGPACHQNFGLNELGPRPELLQTLFNTPPPPESEGCLSINVFAPSPSPTPRAVLVFIHGGGWQLGHGRLDLSSFAAYEDIIAVTFNYRTNGALPKLHPQSQANNPVFGFPSSPEIPLSERNLGLYDQRAALTWIQQNIASFGGDPEKVTIWGQSAGSLAVDLHLQTHPHSPPFRAAIMSSGQMSFGPLSSPSPNDASAWAQLSAAVGCPSSNLSCMTHVPASTLINAMPRDRITFSPQQDNITVLPNPSDRWKSDNIAQVPILTGTVAEEGRGLINDQINLKPFLSAFFPPALVPEEVTEKIVSTYRSDPKLTTDFDIAAAIYTDYLWTCPQFKLASTASSNKIPTWRYSFNASILHLLSEEFSWLGKFHGSEIILLFTSPSTPHTPQSSAVYEYFRGAIARFTKNPAAGPGWPAVGSDYAPVDTVVLGDVGEVPAVAVPFNTTVLDERCSLFNGFYSLLRSAPGDESLSA
ncbi:para-nitrobenzyl esterase [Colletotrichum plurivorum]|uniref:Carboxylic ester hydrolase n=1 Tax=Colletotrichum plurivorum TaxID=2175906 RepID=A0A8H6KAY7_9PEZI|nr:para-nitrobenzyl esterase [Colletotrichum plurivorum]